MTKNETKKKTTRPALKVSSYAPAAAFLGGLRTPGPTRKPAVSRLQMKSLKCLTGGGFRVQTQASASGVNADRVRLKPTVLDHLHRWNGYAVENGWDQEYIDSFIAKEMVPPQEDPETGKKEKEPGVRSRTTQAGPFADAQGRTLLSANGSKISTRS